MESAETPQASVKSNRWQAIKGISIGVAAIGAVLLMPASGPFGWLFGSGSEPRSTVATWCIGLLKSPFCDLLPGSMAEAQGSTAEERRAQLKALGERYGMPGLRPHGPPGMSEKEEAAGYELWLKAATDAEFEDAIRTLNDRIDRERRETAQLVARSLSGELIARLCPGSPAETRAIAARLKPESIPEMWRGDAGGFAMAVCEQAKAVR